MRQGNGRPKKFGFCTTWSKETTSRRVDRHLYCEIATPVNSAKVGAYMTGRKWNGWALAVLATAAGLTGSAANAQPIPKAQVANLIAKVESGVDQFRDYLKRHGDSARAAATSSQNQGRRARRGAASESTKAAAQTVKDDLDNALSDLNRSTNRLRRKFDATDTWMETKVQVDAVMNDARRINQVVAGGTYGTEAARLWAVLRAGINDLARAYGLPPMAV